MSKKIQEQSTLDRLSTWVNQLPRPARIVLNMAISIAVMAMIGVPLVLIIAGEQVNSLESGEVLYTPTIIIAVLWFLLYGFGWNSLVGFDWDEDVQWQAGRPAAYLLLLGILALVFIIFACIFGFLFALVL